MEGFRHFSRLFNFNFGACDCLDASCRSFWPREKLLQPEKPRATRVQFDGRKVGAFQMAVTGISPAATSKKPLVLFSSLATLTVVAAIAWMLGTY
jgi:hypothetical protein